MTILNQKKINDHFFEFAQIFLSKFLFYKFNNKNNSMTILFGACGA